MFFEPKNIQYFSAILFQKFEESKFDKMCDELIGKHLLPMQKY